MQQNQVGQVLQQLSLGYFYAAVQILQTLLQDNKHTGWFELCYRQPVSCWRLAIGRRQRRLQDDLPAHRRALSNLSTWGSSTLLKGASAVLLLAAHSLIEQRRSSLRFHLPVLNLGLMRVESKRRGGRGGVDVFVLPLFLSNALLILERGAKTPEKQSQTLNKAPGRTVW